MKQFIVALVNNLDVFSLDTIRLIPGDNEDNENDAIKKYLEIDWIKEQVYPKLQKHPVVLGEMDWKDGYPMPVFYRDIVAEKTVTYKTQPRNTEDSKSDTKKMEFDPEKYQKTPIRFGEPQFRDDTNPYIVRGAADNKQRDEKENKIYIVGVLKSDLNGLSEFIFKDGTCMPIRAASPEEACEIYSVESANYIECKQIRAIETHISKNMNKDDIFNPEYMNNVRLIIACLSDPDKEEISHYRAYLGHIPPSPLKRLYDLIGLPQICLSDEMLLLFWGDATQEYKEYLKTDGAIDAVDEGKQCISMMTRGSCIWLRR